MKSLEPKRLDIKYPIYLNTKDLTGATGKINRLTFVANFINQTAKDGNMTSLIDNIISLEKEADLIVEQAQANSKKVLKASQDEIARYRDELARELETRLQQLKTEAEKRYQEGLADINRKKSEKLDALRKLPDDYIVFQARKIIDRFSNW